MKRYHIVLGVGLLFMGACTAPTIRRVSNVPAMQGTPTAGRVMRPGAVRVALEAFPIWSFGEPKSRQGPGDPGLQVHSTSMGGNIRVGLHENVKLGLRYSQGLRNNMTPTYDSVPPAPDEAALSFAVELETSFRIKRIGYIAAYLALGLTSIPSDEYMDANRDGKFTLESSTRSTHPLFHLAVLGGVDLDWAAFFLGVNLQTGYTNKGVDRFSLATVQNVVSSVLFGVSHDDVETILMTPAILLGAEFSPVPYLHIGIQAWVNAGDLGSQYAAPGIGAWLAFDSGGLPRKR